MKTKLPAWLFTGLIHVADTVDQSPERRIQQVVKSGNFRRLQLHDSRTVGEAHEVQSHGFRNVRRASARTSTNPDDRKRNTFKRGLEVQSDTREFTQGDTLSNGDRS